MEETYEGQIKEINSKLRDMATGLIGSNISFKANVVQPTVSNWLRGMDVGPKVLFKLARALGRKITIKLEQDWESGLRSGLGEDINDEP